MEDGNGFGLWRHEEERLIRELEEKRWDRKRVHAKCVEFSEAVMAFSYHHPHGNHLNEYDRCIVRYWCKQQKGFIYKIFFIQNS